MRDGLHCAVVSIALSAVRPSLDSRSTDGVRIARYSRPGTVLRAKIPGDYGRSRGVAWYYLGGFGLVHGAFAESASWDGVIARLSSDGDHIWSRRLGGAETDTVASIASDGAGGLVAPPVRDGEPVVLPDHHDRLPALRRPPSCTTGSEHLRHVAAVESHEQV